MKEYICIRDSYVENTLLASQGDKVILLPDNSTVVNNSKTPQQVAYNCKSMVDNPDYFKLIKEEKEEPVKKDNVNHPTWYTQHPSGIECIEITRHYCFSIGNAIKYLWRAGLKKELGLEDKQKEIEDLNKAIWYIKDRIKQLEND